MRKVVFLTLISCIFSLFAMEQDFNEECYTVIEQDEEQWQWEPPKRRAMTPRECFFEICMRQMQRAVLQEKYNNAVKEAKKYTTDIDALKSNERSFHNPEYCKMIGMKNDYVAEQRVLQVTINSYNDQISFLNALIAKTYPSKNSPPISPVITHQKFHSNNNTPTGSPIMRVYNTIKRSLSQDFVKDN